MVKHKAIKDSLDVGTHEEWNDDHIADFADTIRDRVMFLAVPIDSMYDLGQTVGGANPVIVFQDHHVFAYLNTGGVTGQISSMEYQFNVAAGNITYIDDAPTLTTAVWLEAYHTAGLVAEFGLINGLTAAAFTANQDGVYFRIDGGALLAVTGDGAAETTTDITPTLGIPEYGHYRVELGSANAKFYVDDMETPAATHTTNLPDSDLTIKYSIQSQNNVDSKMYVDSVGLQRNRYKG